jgi:hypothetical protein
MAAFLIQLELITGCAHIVSPLQINSLSSSSDDAYRFNEIQTEWRDHKAGWPFAETPFNKT